MKEQVLAGQQHQELPFEQVVELVGPARNPAHTPLFQAMFAWEEAGTGRLSLGDVQVQRLLVPQRGAKFDLTLSLGNEGGAIAGNLKYATALFERATIERHVTYFEQLLTSLVAEATVPVERLAIMPAAERRDLLTTWNDTQRAVADEACLHTLIEAQVRRTPDAPAVVFEETALTYEGLSRRANQLAHHLRALGVGPDARVAICLGRRLELVVGLVGVLKAGGAYVPLDPTYPPERL